jgi:hypothetical protein
MPNAAPRMPMITDAVTWPAPQSAVTTAVRVVDQRSVLASAANGTQ